MTTKDPKSVYDFVVKDAKGDDVDLSFYKGKVLLIVNVASQCGLTNSNYTELNQLYDKYNCWSYSTVTMITLLFIFVSFCCLISI